MSALPSCKVIHTLKMFAGVAIIDGSTETMGLARSIGTIRKALRHV